MTVNGVVVDSSTLVFGGNTSQNGNPNFPSTGSNQLPLLLEFNSNRVPVYGDFYLQLGQGGVRSNGGSGWNTGSANHASTNNLDFIVRRDTDTVENPEPGTLVMIGSAFLLSGLGQRRRV